MAEYVSIKNWEKFQHYKKRNPPWIRLYNELLDDYAFGRLPDASKWHAVGLWLLASRFENRIPADAVWIAQRIGARSPVDLDVLLSAGFIEPYEGASAALAERKQDAKPEGEGEGETEGEDTSADADDGEPSADEADLSTLDVTSDEDWATLRTTLFAPLRQHIWKGKEPPANVPANGRKWDEGRELSYVRDWIRGGMFRPEETADFLKAVPIVMQWREVASLSWLARDEHIPRIREIVGRLRKDQMTKVGKVLRVS